MLLKDHHVSVMFVAFESPQFGFKFSNPILRHVNNAPKLLSFPFIPFSNRVQNHFCWDLNSCTSYPRFNNHVSPCSHHPSFSIFYPVFLIFLTRCSPCFPEILKKVPESPSFFHIFPTFPHIFPGFRPSPALRQGAVLSTSNSPRRSCSISSSGASKTFKATCRKPLS